MTTNCCEGCDADDRLLNAEGYCPQCTHVACAHGNGPRVGLPSVPDEQLDNTIVWIRTHLDTEPPTHVYTCFFCNLLDVECSECGCIIDQIPLNDDFHTIVDDYVFIGCEGFHTPALREGYRLSTS